MKATAEETDGAFLLFADLMSQGKTTPLHAHVNEDEVLFVLEGELWCISKASITPSALAASRLPRAAYPTHFSSPRRSEAAERSGGMKVLGPPPFAA